MFLRGSTAAHALARRACALGGEIVPVQPLRGATAVALLTLLAAAFVRGLLLETGAPLGPPAPPPAAQVFQVDLNRCDAVELTLLPGIGPVTAERIAAFRDECGPLESPEQLLEVHGIGPKTLARIRPYLRMSPSTAAEVSRTGYRDPRGAD